MQNMGQAMTDVLTQSSTLSPSEDHYCEHCNQLVPKYTMVINGKEKVFQPWCKCEVQAWEQGNHEAAELKHKRDIEAKFSISNLGERFTDSTFDKFEAQPGTEKAVEHAKSYAFTFPAYGANSLMIWGPYGNGKSHLAAAVAHKIKEKGHTVVFQTMPELLERIRGTFNNNNKESEKDIMVALQSCELLVLDDIGAEKVSDWVQDVLFRIVDGRYRQKKPIFYTTNLQPSDLKDKVGPRIYDRMVETSILVQNTGTSYRMKIAETRFRQMKMEEVKEA